ncbi:cupin domain-containing protein [Polynucleobacter sp. 86C-FISCH]|uniref:cupin domain-containing protein n=1 Tax=Polynucleobacter sp. 86C-FISCH TaxID=2689101 RepID=UPI001C0E0FD8|nr:cupin domain-containing protein [Polynucleobacter sp. 86C-FISCH]MBU3596169.1 cupin domain-containing protein [Polynucleobacter sp. 86C-FISCH]
MRLVKFSLTLFALVFASVIPAHADENHPGVVTELVVRSGNDWTGSSLPSYLSSAPEVAVMRFTIPPQTALPIHKHPAINAAYVMDGELTVFQEGGIQRNFKKGDVVIEMVEKWHHGINQGSVPVELVVFYATTKDLPLAIKKPNP